MDHERDVLRRLAAARPAHLDGGEPVDPELRARELARAMTPATGGTGERTSPGLVRPRTPQWLRPRWGVGLMSAAAATAVAVTLLPSGGGSGGAGDPGTATPSHDATAREFLLAAAARTEKTGERGKGAYWYQKERRGTLHSIAGEGGKPGYAIDDRQDDQEWLHRDHRRWSRGTDLGARPASERDARAWRDSGSPRSWPGLPEVRYDAEGVTSQDAPGGGVDVVPMGDLRVKDLASLPTEGKALLKRLIELADAEFNAPPDQLRELAVRKAVELALSLPAGPELRAAAYRLLADEPGVRALGTVEDRSGREGHGIAFPSPETGTELRIVLDRTTGAPLGTLGVATADQPGARKGQVLQYTVVVHAAWTDTPPPFDKDLELPRDAVPYDPDEDPDAQKKDAERRKAG
ncbi:CU044_5270 family protein [Streptomyces sp. NPDC057638]|uniref:CU044_5270 family protein n=1 Tax=Streptomyces sp. NPDC057638 TaxID=3346190 RepID=UPI0036C7F664